MYKLLLMLLLFQFGQICGFSDMKKDILISEQEIAKEVEAVAADLNQHYQNREVVIIGILKGSICFLSDLIRHLEFPFQIEFVTASSYGLRGTKPGELKLSGFDALDLKGKEVLLVDDIYDTGRTLSSVFHALEKKDPKCLSSIVLLRKEVDQLGDIIPDWVCFDIEDHFVLGYGLDYKELFRGLKAIYTVEE